MASMRSAASALLFSSVGMLSTLASAQISDTV